MDAEIKDVQNTEQPAAPAVPTKFCKHCGQKISQVAVICPHCGGQVEAFKQETTAAAPIVINNTNTSTNANTNINQIGVGGRPRNKWVAFLLCLFLGVLGAHKFYEGKVGMGILYLLTLGLCGIGVFIDLIVLLLKPNPYYV